MGAPMGRRPTHVAAVGQRFGLLIVTGPGAMIRGRRTVACRCACGKDTQAQQGDLVSGHVKSCGCARSAAARRNGAVGIAKAQAARTTHGLAPRIKRHHLYFRWAGMVARCSNPNHEKFPMYGARGITVCERWRSDFTAFLADMGPQPTPRHTIDRINNDGNYEPGNVRWATPREQRLNQRRMRKSAC